MEWFYAQGDDRIGPVDNAGLSEAVRRGTVNADTLVWREGMSDWTAYATVPDAVAAVGGAAPAVATPTPDASPVSAAAAPAANPYAATAANPYAAPSANLYGGQVVNVELAGRGERLAATMLDGLLGVVLIVPLMIAAAVADGNEALGGIMVGVMVLLGIGLMVFQIVLIVRHSATFGKKVMKLYIADMAGEPASAGTIIGLRMIVNGVIGAVPFIGGFYSLADILCIFRDDRRCIHDMIASTQVLKRT